MPLDVGGHPAENRGIHAGTDEDAHEWRGLGDVPLGFSPELRTPPFPATHVRVGTGHRTRTRDYPVIGDTTADPLSKSVHSTHATSCRIFTGEVLLSTARSGPSTVLSLQLRSAYRVFDHASDGPPREIPRLNMPPKAGAVSVQLFEGLVSTVSPACGC